MSTNIYQDSTACSSGEIAGRISQLRDMQADLRNRPVTGSLKALKRPFYQLVRSTFSRQHRLNAATIDLIDSIYREVGSRSAPPEGAASPIRETPVPKGANGGRSSLIETGMVQASCGQTQDQAKLNGIRPLNGFEAVYSAPAELRMPERVALYSLVFGLQPRNCLEIGTFRGGSTAIIYGAMEDTGFGRLACVDPMPQVDPALWSRLTSRCRMFQGPSPDILPQVARETGAAFDFAFIDGNHTYEYLRADIAGVIPHLADDAHLLFHDAHYSGVKKAIDEAVSSRRELIDCGLVSIEPTVLKDNGQSQTWAGLRLLRFQRGKRR